MPNRKLTQEMRRNRKLHNSMVITTPFEELVAESSPELLSVLQTKRKNGYGAFWLSQEAKEFPVLFVGVKQDYAWLNYLEQSDLPGFLSKGEFGADEPDMAFMDMHGHIDLRPATCVVRESVALEAVVQFMSDSKRPRNLEWVEL